ncbi:MAG: hypothetical protein ABI778_12260, partial [Ignavibacteriota bacterium]
MKAAFLVFAIMSFFALSGDAAARSFSINGQKVIKLNYNSGAIIDISNFAGQTQNLSVTVINSDATVKLQMLDINSHIVDIGSSLVLRVDSTGLDHGTLIVSHPSRANTKFSTSIVLSDANKTTIDTITINIDDSQLPPLKQLISVTPKSPVIIPVTRGAVMAITLNVANLTSDKFSVWLTEPWGSTNFFPLKAFFSFNGGSNPGTENYTYTINYTPSNAILPDSALFIFMPAVDGADGDTVKVIMIDT